MQNAITEKLTKLTDVSRQTGISNVTLGNQVKAGALKAAKIGKFWWVRESDLQHFLRSRFGQEQDEKQAA